MTFDEIDEAIKIKESQSMSTKHVRKRKNSIISLDDSTRSFNEKPGKYRKKSFDDTRDSKDSSDCRTGRWTSDEIEFCDKLVALFQDGKLPLGQGTKLNDFLASMHKSKQSRLTKKMKNAKLSSKIFQGTDCFITEISECTAFSEVEDKFLQAISDPKERAELKFHMQKEWRENFSSFCLQIGQPVDADAWLSSVEEMDRRVSMARDASRIARRKLMMGFALCEDFKSAPPGVYIERTKAEIFAAQNNEPLSLKPTSADAIFNTAETDEVLALLDGDFNDKPSDIFKSLDFQEEGFEDYDMIGKSSILHSSPFLNKVMAYVKRHNVPFEHVDVWVPNTANGPGTVLGFAGCATSDTQLMGSGKTPACNLDSEDKFNLLAFGDYSHKFSFADGDGIPGRVFRSGVPVWDDKICSQNFERTGGANQWGISSYVAIPLPSPNVGRIVICLYSRHQRKRDDALIHRLQEEFTKLLPTPKWKLVIDMSTISHAVSKPSEANKTSFAYISSSSDASKDMFATNAGRSDGILSEIINLLGDNLASNMFAASSEVQNVTGLRLFLLKACHTSQEEEIASTLFGSYSSYLGCGRSSSEIVMMLCRDFMFLTQGQSHQPATMSQSTHSSYDYTDNRQTGFHPPGMQQFHQSYAPSNANFASNYNNLSTLSFNDGTVATEMCLAPSDPSMLYYPIQDGPGLDNFRSSSPALSPIVANSTGDNLSVISN